jgi:lysophospholipase L1-like esterase
MGDSITDGVQGHDDTFVTRGGFRPKLDELLQAQGAELIGYKTCPCPAYPGVISSKLHEQLAKDHFTCGSSDGPRHPDIALMLIGVNDLGRFLKPPKVVADVESMLLDLWQASPRTTVLLASTLTHGAYPTAELNAGLKALVNKMKDASHPIEYVPMQEKTNMCNPNVKLCSYDLVHPNKEGYSSMAQVWWEYVEPRLPKKSIEKAQDQEPPARSMSASYKLPLLLAAIVLSKFFNM